MHDDRRRRSRSGLTLLETALLISVLGIALAALIPTFLHEVRLSKLAEASEQLARMHQRAAAYYALHHKLVSGRRERECLPEAAGPAPAQPSDEPQEVSFQREPTPGHETWSALGFEPAYPVRYRYSLLTEHAGCGPRPKHQPAQVTFVAEGDLDGDRVLSRFERRAASVGGELVPVGRLRVERRLE